MKKKKIKFDQKQLFLIDLHPYSQQCLIVCNGQISDAYKFLKNKGNKNAESVVKHIDENRKEYKDDYEHNTGSARLYTQLPKGYIMMISKQNSWVTTVGLVVHEATHLAHHVLEGAGVKLQLEISDESYTYLVEKIVKDILEKIY